MKKSKKLLVLIFSIVFVFFSTTTLANDTVSKSSAEQLNSETKYCKVRLFEYYAAGYPLSEIASIISVNGKSVDNLKEGIFEAGTVLEIEREYGFFWFQKSDDEPGYAIGRFGDAEAKTTTYVVPEQENVGISVFGGGEVFDLPNAGMIRSVNSKIVAMENEMLKEPVTETSSRNRNGVLITVVADEMKSTDEYDYEFVGWESDSGTIEFTNPTEKTTQFISDFELGTVVFAIYKEIPKEPVQKGNLSMNISTTMQNIEVEGLEEAVLSNDDKEMLEAGKDIKVSVVVEKKELNTIEEKELKLMQDAMAEGMELGEVLDIHIEKQVEGKELEIVKELFQPIKISIDVPEQLRTQNTNRVFTMIHLHDGKVESLSDLDNDNNTITFETSKFSLYGVAFKNVDSQPGNNVENQASPQTGDNEIIINYIILMATAMIVFYRFKQKKETKYCK